MRTRLGWALCVLGVLVAVLGAAVMIALGPDSRRSSGPHPVDTDGIAIVTAPEVISWADVQVDVLAEVPVRKPVFVGIANTVDVQDYVGKTQRIEVTDFHTPWKVRTREAKGRPNLPGAPTALDWWIEQSAGLGGASISTQLPDEPVSAVVLSVGSTNLSGVEVTIAYGIKGGFYKGAGLLLLGLGLAWLGWLLRRGVDLFEEEVYEEVEEVVYVYVDEDGVEHEISADEAASYEVVEEESDLQVLEPAPDPEPEPEPTQPKVPGVLTAAEIAAGMEPEPARSPEPGPEPAADPERVIYVFVDADGVEHEVGEDELDQFEVVDEEDES